MTPPAQKPVRSVSVLMPTWQGEEFLERVLTALSAQDLTLPWDMLVVDSGSTDATLELLERFRPGFPVPLTVRSIHQVKLYDVSIVTDPAYEGTEIGLRSKTAALGAGSQFFLRQMQMRSRLSGLD